MVEKKNTDYSASAVNLTNPDVLRAAITVLHNYQVELGLVEADIVHAVPSELLSKKKEISGFIEGQMAIIRGIIDSHGSYQDVEHGAYAVKQRRESITYKPELVRQYAPSKVASFVLVESVDTKAMDAMIKAGQITPDDAKKCGETKESFAYIIK
jgi:hypothetical protein